jgi:hypothetical protein
MSDYIVLIEDCEERSGRLGDWEIKFIDSLRRQLEQGRSLTHKQIAMLEECWERATARG